MIGVIAIHCGAGRYQSKNDDKIKSLAKRACRRGIALLKLSKSALEVVKEVISILENDPQTNCGRGSNLTSRGTVECDASLMEGATGRFGACGAVRRAKNPIRLAFEICQRQSEPAPLGLVPPMLLVGGGAARFARQRGLELVRNGALVTERARRQHAKYASRLHAAAESRRLDTVGAVCVDRGGAVAAGCSSGGLLLKDEGRLGQAAAFGCGVWADDAVGVTTSGCGEDLIRTGLARMVAADLQGSVDLTVDLDGSLRRRFFDSKLVRTEEKQCGVLVLCTNRANEEVNLLWAHSSEGLGLGYMSTDDARPKAIISRLPTGAGCNIGGAYFSNSTK